VNPLFIPALWRRKGRGKGGGGKARDDDVKRKREKPAWTLIIPLNSQSSGKTATSGVFLICLWGGKEKKGKKMA